MKIGLLLFMNIVMFMFLWCPFWLCDNGSPSLTTAKKNSHFNTSGSNAVRCQGEDCNAPSSSGPTANSLQRKMYPDLHRCSAGLQRNFYYQRGDYWVLENYIPADLTFRCNESITYTTHGEYTFLDNLDPVTAHWQGPVSIAWYAPGDDFNATVATILYLRQCARSEIRKLVTFHIFFHDSHTPKEIPSREEMLRRRVNCQAGAPNLTNVTTYRAHNKLLYPINVARNIARLAARTYFVFPADVELYPSVDFIPDFLTMLKKPDVSNTTFPRVFVFSVFEVKENISIPETKNELLGLLHKGDAAPFHNNVCSACHSIPGSQEWLEAPVKPGMTVFQIGKRTPPFQSWEPFFVGTNLDPLYDERLTWEGKSDKMTQAYIMCLHDYEFHVLDNAFLVHRPGIKVYRTEPARGAVVGPQNILIHNKIQHQYDVLFGSGKNCSI
ncbi:beta-1,4-glucuronyltransferase 1-like [Procambarus clarkii]|uniref:beta-1,4-glucuronyltransferase 1-like n=1 Tax=Procambarus clarkii TaxID=6728 RepID=UPI00374330C5